jgi:hypothetical protein
VDRVETEVAGLTPDESRERIRAAIEQRYTLPSQGPAT